MIKKIKDSRTTQLILLLVATILIFLTSNICLGNLDPYFKKDPLRTVIFVLSLLIYILWICWLWGIIDSKHKIWGIIDSKLWKTVFIVFVALIIGFVLINGEIKLFKGKDSDFISYFGNSGLYAMLTFVGLTITALGFFLTFRQVKHIEDRIFGYEELYAAIFDLIKDTQDRIEKKKNHVFYYYGTIPIPGHLVIEQYIDNYELIERYKINLEELLSVIDKEKFNFICLKKILIDEFYEGKTNTYKNRKRIDSDLESIFNMINDKKEVNFLGKNSMNITDYYFSNGHVAIFAVALGYSKDITRPKADKKDTSIKADNHSVPSLIGFKTTDRAIMKELKEKFDYLKREAKYIKLKETLPNDIDNYVEDIVKELSKKITCSYKDNLIKHLNQMEFYENSSIYDQNEKNKETIKSFFFQKEKNVGITIFIKELFYSSIDAEIEKNIDEKIKPLYSSIDAEIEFYEWLKNDYFNNIKSNLKTNYKIEILKYLLIEYSFSPYIKEYITQHDRSSPIEQKAVDDFVSRNDFQKTINEFVSSCHFDNNIVVSKNIERDMSKIIYDKFTEKEDKAQDD